MLNFKKMPKEGTAGAMAVPITILSLLAIICGYFTFTQTFKFALWIYLGVLLLITGVSLLKFASFIKKSEELEYGQDDTILSIVQSVCEYFSIEEPEVRIFESDFDEVFAVGFGKPHYLMVSDSALKSLDRDELEFLVAQEMVNIVRGRMTSLTLFAPDGKTAGIGHLFAKWIGCVEKSNDKAVLVMTKNLEQCIKTIIRVNDFDEESEMSIEDMVRIFVNTGKSQLKNITDAINLDDYIIDRVVELLKFSRSRDYKIVSDSTPFLNIRYGARVEKAEESDYIIEDNVENISEHIGEERSFDITEDEKNVLYAQEKYELDDDAYYREVMKKQEYVNSEIEIDIEEEAEQEFRNMSQKYKRNNALREVAATSDEEEDLKQQRTTVMKDKYNITREIREENEEYDDYPDTEGIKKKVIIIVVGLIVAVGLIFACKALLFDKKDKPADGTNVEDKDKTPKTVDEQLKELIGGFHKSYEKYIDTGDVSSYEKFVKKGSPLATYLESIAVKEYTLKFSEVDFKDYEFISQDEIEYRVHEVIDTTKDGEVTSKDKDKVYTAVKVEEKWMLNQIKDVTKETDGEDDNVVVEDRYPNSTFSEGYTYKYSAIPSSTRLEGAEADEVEAFITNFNNAWIDYVNTGNKDVLNYYLKDQPAYNTAIKFGANPKYNGMKQQFQIMDITEARKTQNAYYVWVHEKIEEKKDGIATVKEYHWIYMLRKNGSTYGLQEYFSDPAY